MKKHPECATKHRLPGTELRLIRGKYYLYEYKTIYDQSAKKPKKISGKSWVALLNKRALRNLIKEKLRKCHLVEHLVMYQSRSLV
jgi:hypothetical protein